MLITIGMKIKSICLCVCLALGMVLSSSPVYAGADLTGAFALEGVAGFVESKARETWKAALSQKGADWMADAFATAIESSRKGEAKGGFNRLFYQDPEIKAIVQEELKKRVVEFLPDELERLIAQDLLGGAVGKEELKEVREIAKRVIEEMNKSMNDRIDEVISQWYDKGVLKLQNMVNGAIGAGRLDITDIRGSVRRAFDLSTIGDIAASQLGKIAGDSTVAAIRGRIEDALNGELPKEAVDALKKGPQEFEKYMAEVQKYLPGTALKSLLNRPLIKLPSQAYAVILAANAAGHFARAYKGVYVDLYELKRGTEVTRVMVWQLLNKKYIDLSLMQLGDIARGLADKIGSAAFDGFLDKLKEPLDKIQELTDKIDELAMKPLKAIDEQLKKAAADIQKALEDLQRDILKPINDGLATAQKGLDRAAEAISDTLPENFNGIPASWEDAKKKVGIEGGLLGKAGDVTPKEALKELAKILGLDEWAKKILVDLLKVKEAMLKKTPDVVIKDIQTLGPASSIVEAEKVPPENESQSEDLDPVLLHNGEYVGIATDIVIPGRGLDFRFQRSFRGRSSFLGELGFGWTHSYAERLLPWNDGKGDGVTYINEEGRKFFFRLSRGSYEAPHDLDLSLVNADSSGFELSGKDGVATFFNSTGRPVQKCDRFANCIKYTYNDKGLVESVTDVFGRKVFFKRRDDGLISKLEDFAGRTISFSYNDDKELIGVTSPAVPEFTNGKTTAYLYESGHRLSMIMDPKGNVYLRNKYDGDGRVIAQSYGGALWATVAYSDVSSDERPFDATQGKRATSDGISSRAWVKDADGKIKLYEHDAEGHLVNLWEYTDGNYNLIARGNAEENREELPQEDELKKRFNAYGQLIEDGEARYEYYPAFDPDGDGAQVTNAVTDDKMAGGYLKRIIRENEYQMFEYDPIGNITSRISSSGVRTRFSVNALNQVVKEENKSNGAQSEMSYDANDNLTKIVVNEEGRRVTHEYFYDEMDRFVEEKVSSADETKTIVSEDGSGAYEYDDLGRVKTITRGKGSEKATTRYLWNENGLLVRLTDPAGGVTHFEYDALDRIVAERYPNATLRKFEYDDGGNVVSVTDRNGSLISMKYDSGGRLIERSAKPARGVMGTVLQRFEYDGLGRLVTALDLGEPGDPSDDAESHFVYDSNSNPIAENFKDGWLQRQYDDKGQVSAMAFPDGGVFSFSRDATRLAVFGENGKIGEFRYDAMFNYMNPVPIVEAEFGPKITLEAKFAHGKQFSRIYFHEGSVVLHRWEIHHDDNDRFISRVIGNGDVDRNFQRDSLSRLTVVQDSEDSCDSDYFKVLKEWRYKYDANGNVVTDKKRTSYDAAGNVISDGKREFRYDAFGRLVSVWEKGAQIASYRYDAFDRRVSKKVRGIERRAIWDGWRLVEEIEGDNRSVYLYADNEFSPFARVSGDKIQYLLSDYQGSVIAAIDPTGKDELRCDYSPYGERYDCANMPHPFGFAGHIHDPETGLIYMRNRYYDPVLSRFITPDPMGYKADTFAPAQTAIVPIISYHRGQGGVSRATIPNRSLNVSSRYDAYPFGRGFALPRADIKPGEPNLYMYASNDPTAFSDPLGLASLLFDRSDGVITLRDKDDNILDSFHASNNVKNKKEEDSLKNGKKGPFPIGTFSLGVPEFSSKNYQDYFYARYYLHQGQTRKIPKAESRVTGPGWAEDKKERARHPNLYPSDYSVSQGRVRFRAGSQKGGDDKKAWNRALFIHSGRRNNWNFETQGCIRMSDDEIEFLAAEAISLMRQGDPLTTITVQK